jgi:magnesium chelatase subunit I
MAQTKIKTLGELKKSGYISRSTKDELRDNLIKKLSNKETVFAGIWGYEETVIPDLERAILAGHDINLLGLRGQAKTRLARLMVNLLDEYIPVIEGSELNDDPLNPISRYGMDKVKELGDATAITWMHRDERYSEKLATPDVSIADLIGDVDPIKAATLKLPYSTNCQIYKLEFRLRFLIFYKKVIFRFVDSNYECLLIFNLCLPPIQKTTQIAVALLRL